MSRSPTSRSRDIQRLVDEGHQVALVDGMLVVSDVPFVDEGGKVRRGTLATTLSMRGDRIIRPERHDALWAGGRPCDASGQPLDRLIQTASNRAITSTLSADYLLCNKPRGREFADYHELVTTYVALVGTHAAALDPTASARSRRGRAPGEVDAAPFRYVDTASARAGTGAAQDRIRGAAIGIIGLGGTGSYVLDLVAKTPVAAIHLFDADRFDQHNAFRTPGAATSEEICAGSLKVDHLAEIYSRMHRGIVPHPHRIGARTAPLLDMLDFVFLCLDEAAAKPAIIDRLALNAIAFVDVGMGLSTTEGGIVGAVRTTYSPPTGHAAAARRIPMTGDPDGVYATNIQIPELNALNAALAVVAWKRHAGFYAATRPNTHGVYIVEDGALHIEGEA